jgi:hypothetical protein
MRKAGRKITFFRVLVHLLLQEGNGIVRKDSGFQGHSIVFHYKRQSGILRKDSCFQSPNIVS